MGRVLRQSLQTLTTCGARGFLCCIKAVQSHGSLVARDPRLPAELRGTRRDQMVLIIDLAPTMLVMGGAVIPHRMQGRDFGPLLRDESIGWRSEWFYEHTYNTQLPRRPIAKSEGVRTDHWKYIRYIERDPLYEQLFDLKNDPWETNNLASRFPDKVEELEQQFLQWKSEVSSGPT